MFRVDVDNHLPPLNTEHIIGETSRLDCNSHRRGAPSLNRNDRLQSVAKRRRRLEINLDSGGQDVDTDAAQLDTSKAGLLVPISQCIVPIPRVIAVKDNPLRVTVRVSDFLSGWHSEKLAVCRTASREQQR